MADRVGFRALGLGVWVAAALGCGPAVGSDAGGGTGIADPDGTETGYDEAVDASEGPTSDGSTTDDPDDGMDESIHEPVDSMHWHALALCETAMQCACAPEYETVEACIDDILPELDALAEAAYDRALPLNPACAAAQVERVASRCGEPQAWVTDCQATQCSLFAGEQGLGAGCEDTQLPEGVSDCADGLECTLGECATYCVAIPENGQCAGLFFPNEARCAEGLTCFVEDGGTGTCAVGPGEGDDCQRPSLIDPSCGSGLHCIDGSCEIGPAVGSPCIGGTVCEAGAHCGPEGLCVEGRGPPPTLPSCLWEG